MQLKHNPIENGPLALSTSMLHKHSLTLADFKSLNSILVISLLYNNNIYYMFVILLFLSILKFSHLRAFAPLQVKVLLWFLLDLNFPTIKNNQHLKIYMYTLKKMGNYNQHKLTSLRQIQLQIWDPIPVKLFRAQKGRNMLIYYQQSLLFNKTLYYLYTFLHTSPINA